VSSRSRSRQRDERQLTGWLAASDQVEKRITTFGGLPSAWKHADQATRDSSASPPLLEDVMPEALRFNCNSDASHFYLLFAWHGLRQREPCRQNETSKWVIPSHRARSDLDKSRLPMSKISVKRVC
jgi:hypothetical protein